MRMKQGKKTALIFAIILILVVAYFLIFSMNMVTTLCIEETRAEVINIVNNSNEIIQKLDIFYEDFFQVFKDENDKVTMITMNSALINQINMIIQTEIQNRLNELRTKTIYLPTGAFTGMSIFSIYGTKIPINVRIISNCYTVLSSEFKEMGINQTLHRLQINCYVEIDLLVPSREVKSDVTNEILITESVIVGEVPSTFLGENTTTDYLDLLPD